jgi:hypothetical protein
MRASLLLAGAVVVATASGLGALVAFGDTHAVSYADVGRMVATVGSTPDLQVALALYAPGDPVADFSAVLDESSTHPARPIAQSGNAVNSELFLFLERQSLAEEITAGGTRYLRIDLSLLRPALSTRAEQRELSVLEGHLGDRWLLLPAGTGAGRGPAQSGEGLVQVLGEAVLVHSRLDATGHPGAAGATVSGSVASLVGALRAALGPVVPGGVLAPLSNALAGTYRVTFLCDRSGMLREVDLGLSGLGRTGIGVLINHGPIPISAPSGAIRPSAASWRALLGLARALVPAPFAAQI